jgi:hypothetical protein
LSKLLVCTASLIDDNEFDNDIKERCSQVDNGQLHSLIDTFWFIAQKEMK